MPALYGRLHVLFSQVRSAYLVLCIGLLAASTSGAAPLAEPADPTLPIRGDNWVLFLDIAESTADDAAHILSPRFGISADATDDFDIGVDFVAPPVTPIGGRPNAHLHNAALAGDFQSLLADMRSFPTNPFTSVTWTLVVENDSGADWLLSWDSGGIPRLWATATIDDRSSVLDMRETGLISVPTGGETTYDITVSRAAVGAPVDPPGQGLFGLLRAGQMVAANVPNSVYDGLPLFLTSDPVDGNPADTVLLPAGFTASATRLMRDVRIERDGVALTEFAETVEIELSFDEADIPAGVTVDQLIPFRIGADGGIEILRVVSRGTNSITFQTSRFSTIGAGVSETNDAPTIRENIADVTVYGAPGSAEIELVPTATTSVFFDDETPVDDLTYSATVGDSTILGAPVVTGSVLTLTTADLAVGSTEVTVTATDGGSLATSTTFLVTVSAPVIADIGAQFTDEDQPLDVDVDVAYDGTVVIEAAESDAGGSLLASVAVAGSAIVITPLPDVTGSTEVAVLAYDAADATISASATFAVTISAVNDAPTFDTIAAQSVGEDAGPTTVDITGVSPGGGDDETTQAVTFTASSGDGTIVADPVVTGTGDTRTLTLQPEPDANGEATVTVTATDDGEPSQSTSVDFTVTVVAVPDAPTLAEVLPQTLAVQTNIVISLSVTDPDSDTFEIGVDAGPSLGSVVLNDPALTVTYTAGTIPGSDSFEVSVTDAEGGVSNAVTVDVTVTTPPNLSPVVAGDIAVDVPKGVSSVINLGQYAVDPESSPLTFSIAQTVSNGQLTLTGANATYTPATGFVGPDGFIFSVSDGANTAAGIVQLNVVNALPTVEAGPAVTDEDTAVTLELTVADADGDAVTVSVSDGPGRGAVALDGLVATYTPNAEFNGTDTFTLRPNDGFEDGADVEVVVTVLEVDDPARLNTVRSLPSIRAQEGSSARVIDLGGEQPLFFDPDSEVTYAAGSSDPAIVDTSLDDTLLTIEFVGPGIAAVTVAAVGADETVTFAVEVVAEDVPNEPPVVTTPRPQSGTEGEDIVFTPRVTDPDGDDLAFTLVDVERLGPAGQGDTDPVVTVDPDTGDTAFVVDSISGLQAKFRVTIDVTDGESDPIDIPVLVFVASANEPPQISADATVAGAVGESVEIEVRVTDDDEGDELEIGVTIRERELSSSAAVRAALREFNRADIVKDGDASIKTFSITPDEGLDGRLLTLQWVADDGQDAVSATTQIAVGEDVKLPPSIAPIAGVEVSEAEDLLIAIETDDPDAAEGDIVSLAVSGLVGSAVLDAEASAISWEDIGYDRAGAYTLTITATDVDGLSATESVRVRVFDVNRPPSLALTSTLDPVLLPDADPDSLGSLAVPPSVTVQMLTVATIGVTALDADGGNLSVTVRGLPNWARARSRGTPREPVVSITIEPPRDAEPFTLLLRASDDGGLTDEVAIQVLLTDPPNSAPTIDDIASVTVVEEETATFAVEVKDSDADDVVVTAGGLPDGATFDGVTFAWTTERGAAANSPYEITLAADDGEPNGFTETTVSVTVLPAKNRPPVVGAVPGLTIAVGETTTVDVGAVASDPDDDPLTFAFKTAFAASNVTADEDAGTIVFESDAETDGAGEGFYPTTVRVSDGRGGRTTKSFLLTVAPAEVGIVTELAVAGAIVSPEEGTAAEAFQFSAVVRSPGGVAPSDVTVTLTRDEGGVRTLTLAPTGAGDLEAGAAYSVEALLGVGTYAYEVTARTDAAVATAVGDGPTVFAAPVGLTNVAVEAGTGDIPVRFVVDNPNAGQNVSLEVEYRVGDDGAWLPAQVSGAISDLQSGSHTLVWHSASDVPAAAGEAYALRLRADAASERVSPGFRVVNARPAAPVLAAIEPSSTRTVVVAGTTANALADVVITVNDEAVASAVTADDGSFRATTPELSAGTYTVRAVVSLLGLRSEQSAPVTAVVDPIAPQITILSPESGAEVPTLDPLITFRLDFGLSGGDLNAVEFALNGKAVAATHNPATGVFTASDQLFDQRIYVATVRATKYNGLSSTQGWPFFVNRLADDETPPTASSFEPLGTIRAGQPEVRFAVSDGESGIDPTSVAAVLDGAPLALEYRPTDERGGAAFATAPEPLDDGIHNVTAAFADLAGNEASAAWTFVVKTQAAAPPQLGDIQRQGAPNQGPLGGLDILAITNVSPFTLAGQAAADTEVLVAVDGVLAGVARPDADGVWAFDIALTSDGAFAVTLQTRDEVGNVSPPSDPVAVVYDTSEPELRVANPALGAPTGNLTPVFQGTILDALSGVDPASVSLTVAGEAQAAGYDGELGTFTYAALSAFTSGESIDVALSAADIAGNVATVSGTVTFDDRRSDVTPPVVLNPTLNGASFVSGVIARIREADAAIRFVVSDDLSGVDRVFGTLDGRAIEFDIVDSVATLAASELSEGEHVLLVRASDAQGNQTAALAFRFVRDTSTAPPVLNIASLTNSRDIEVSGSGVEAGAAVTVTVNGAPVEAFVDGDSFRTALARLLAGVNTIVATATDTVGNTATGETVTVTLDTTPPDVTFLAPVAGAIVDGSTNAIVAQVDDANGVDLAAVSLSIDDMLVAATISEAGAIEYSAAEPFAAGDPLRHFVSVTVRDLAGNEARRGAEFFVDAVPPSIDGIVPSDGETLQTVEPLLAATIAAADYEPATVELLFGVDGDALSDVTDDELNYTLDIPSGQVTYTPLLDDRTTYRAILRVSDGVGNAAEATWTFTVDIAAEDDSDPVVTILFPRPGESVDDSGLDILSFAVGDSAGIDGVTLFVNDPSGNEPLTLGGLVAEGTAQYDEKTGVVRLFGRRIFVAMQLRGGGFSFDPLELNALERSLTGGDNASFDPLELNALERSLGGDTGGADVGALEKSLTSSAGLLGIGTNTIGIQVADLSGNVSFATWSFEVSLDPPAAPLFDGGRRLTKDRDARVTGRVPDLAGSTSLPVTVSLRVNGVAAGLVEITDVSGEFTIASVGLNAGENLVTATAQDSAGNLSDRSDTLTIVLDETPPSLSVDPIASASGGATLTVTGVVTDDQDGDISSLTVLLNDVATELPTAQGAFSAQLSLTDGANEVSVVAIDAAGNEATSESATVAVDVAAPTTAPASVSAVPTTDARGVRLSWAPDENAASYTVYRSSVAFTDASGLAPVASRVADAAYTDFGVLSGSTVHYAVASVDAAGNSDASVISPVLATTLIKDRGGVAALTDGTRFSTPRNGLFANVLLAATVEIGVPATTPDLAGAITGTAREVLARTSSGATLTSFNLPATLTIPAPVDVEVDDESPAVYALSGATWSQLDSTPDAAAHASSAPILGSGVFQLAEPAAVSETPWDVNGDGAVNIVDLVTVASAFGTSVPAGSPADINGDGVVDIVDLVTVSSHFGEETVAVASAPALAGSAAPMAWLRLDRVGGDGTTTEFEVRARAETPLAGYEFQLVLPEGASIVSTSSGDLLGDDTFWMPPIVGERAVTVAAARLGSETADSTPAAGVAARVVVRVAGDAPTGDVFLRDVRLVDTRGALVAHRVGPPAALGQSAYVTDLLPNYPNPFNPETWIPFTLAADSAVTIRIYGPDGAAIRTLNLGLVEGGDHRPRGAAAYWNGRNELGERVASGVYFYELEAGDYREMRRLVIVK